MSRYKAYSEYRDSGVDWFDSLPTKWDVKRISYIAQLQSGDAIVSEQIEAEGSYAVYGGNGLRGYSSNFNLEGDYILIGRQGALCGNINYGSGKFWASEHAVVVYPLLDVDIKWLGETLRAMNLNQYNVSAAQPGLAVTNITCLKIPFPSRGEQEKIAAFLDHETAKIDALIEKQQRLIELLKEKRQAVISHAVTKGLNPNAPMKDSGVEWLGEVPAHWDIKRIGALFSESNARAISREEIAYPILSVSIHNGISDKELDEEELDRKVSRSDDKSLYKTIQKNGLAYNMMRAWQGAFGAAELSGLVSPAYVVCHPIKPLNSKYFELVLRTGNAVVELKKYSRGITDFRLRLYWDEFKSICVPVPPHTEVEQILREITKTNTTYDILIAAAEEQIRLLQERRTALISAAVTGKIDVRDWQPAAVQEGVGFEC
jgi:type I restriction enzyme S subunit